MLGEFLVILLTVAVALICSWCLRDAIKYFKEAKLYLGCLNIVLVIWELVILVKFLWLGEI